MPTQPSAGGLPCASDADLRCPFAHCIAGRCGGCSGAADCKPGASCAATPFGMACVPGVLAPPGPMPPPPVPTAPTPTVPVPVPPPAGADRFANARALCVERTNQYRARVGVGPVGRRVDLEGCVDSEAAADGARNTPHGSFGRCGESAQNECPGYPGSPEEVVASCLEQMFGEGPGEPYADHGHYLNMTDPAATGVACGFAVMPDGSLWVAQDFTKR